MAVGKLYSLGYRTPRAQERLDKVFAQYPDTFLVDIRYSPKGLRGWDKQALEARYQASYMHVPELGNRNYRNPGHIEIVNLDAGVERIVKILESGLHVILLCACENYNTCHRHLVVEAVQQRMKELGQSQV